jgi:hypothetical protein
MQANENRPAARRHSTLKTRAILGMATLALASGMACGSTTIPPVPAFGTFSLPDHGQWRYTPQGYLEWLDTNFEPGSSSFDLTLKQWNPGTGAAHVRKLDMSGFVGPYQTPFRDGTLFLVKKTSWKAIPATQQSWRAEWLEPQGITSIIPVPTPADELTLQLITLPNESVFVLERAPTTHYIGGYWLQRQRQTLMLTVMPELPQAYRGDFTSVALDDHRIMVLGGSVAGTNGKYRGCSLDNSCQASTWILDLRSKQWRQGPNLLTPRAEAAAFRLPDGSVIVAGGWTPFDKWGPGPTRTAERWNPQRNAFEALPPMPVATAKARGYWLPGYEGRILIFAQGLSADLPAFDVATHSWFDAGSFGASSEEGACAFFPFRFEGRFYAWQRYRNEGHYSDKVCGMNNASLATLALPREPVREPSIATGIQFIATNRNIPSATFVPPAGKEPAVLVGGTVHTGMNNYPFAGSVEGITASGQLLALPTLNHARANPAVFRVGDGLLVVGGNAKSVYRREPPKLPVEWLASLHEGLKVQWQDLPSAPTIDPNAIVGQGADGRLFVLGDHGEGEEVDQIKIQVQDGLPHFKRSAWLHLDRARSNEMVRPDLSQPGQVVDKVQVRELADGRVIVTGGAVQDDKIVLLTDKADDASQPDTYVSTGEFVDGKGFDTWSPSTRQWTKSPDAPLGQSTPAILEDGHIAMVDGDDDPVHLKVVTFNPATNRWVAGDAPLPGMASGAKWFTTQGELLFTGYMRPTPANTSPKLGVQRFDPRTGHWQWLWKDTQGRFTDGQHFGGRYEGLLLVLHGAGDPTILIPAGGL